MCGLILCVPVAAQVTQTTVDIQVSGKILQYYPPPPPPCTPNLSGMDRQLIGGNTVSLPKITTHDINSAGDNTVPGMNIQFRATGCTGTQANHMWIHFTANVDSDGRIITNAGSSSPVRFEIRDNNTNGQRIIVGGSAGSQPGSTPYQGTSAPFSGSANYSRSADKYYGVRWYAGTHVVNAGIYSASVTANFKYH